jgi:hypothetical protein
MTIAVGAFKSVRIKKETTAGMFAGASGAQELRRVSFDMNVNMANIASNEIKTSQQTSVNRGGALTGGGTLNGELSPGAYVLPMQSAMCRDFATGATTGAQTTISASSSAPHFSRSAGSFITNGFKIGDVISPTGFVATANNGQRLIITALTATAITVVNHYDGSAPTITTEAAGASVTIALAGTGKKTHIPQTGHTDDSYSVEEWHADIAQSLVHMGVKWNGFGVQVDPNNMTTVAFPAMGLGKHQESTSQQFTSPTAPATGDGTTGTSGALVIGGTSVYNTVTGVSFTLDNGMTTASVVGSRYSPSVFIGRKDVTGQFTIFFENLTEYNAFLAETERSLVLVQTVSPSSTAKFVSFVMPRFKITNFNKNDTETGGCIVTCQFVALENVSGGSGTTSEATTLSVQDSDA